MTKRETRIKDMLLKLKQMKKKSEKALARADRSFEKELKAYKSK